MNHSLTPFYYSGTPGPSLKGLPPVAYRTPIQSGLRHACPEIKTQTLWFGFSPCRGQKGDRRFPKVTVDALANPLISHQL